MEIGINIENNRDDMAYGSPLNEEELLKEKIDEFLEMKKLIESEIK